MPTNKFEEEEIKPDNDPNSIKSMKHRIQKGDRLEFGCFKTTDYNKHRLLTINRAGEINVFEQRTIEGNLGRTLQNFRLHTMDLDNVIQIIYGRLSTKEKHKITFIYEPVKDNTSEIEVDFLFHMQDSVEKLLNIIRFVNDLKARNPSEKFQMA